MVLNAVANAVDGNSDDDDGGDHDNDDDLVNDVQQFLWWWWRFDGNDLKQLQLLQ